LAAGLRFRAPEDELVFQDGIHGRVALAPAAGEGDFLIVRRDGIPAYQLAVVVDDEAQAINQVVRGADLLDSTARQLAIVKALGYRVPNYVHVPLVLDKSGARLAKRSDGLSLQELRAAGVSPARVVGWVTRSLGLADGTALPAVDFLPRFDVARIAQEPVQVDRSEFGL
jgi:glutamyl-tRNA synthetase